MIAGDKANANRSAENPLPPKIAALLRESGWISMLLLTLYLALILFTFSKGDPGWSHSVAVERIHNSGGTLGAEAGTLAIMAGGASADVERVAPAFAALGRVTHVGPQGAGQLAKLANQMIVGISIGAVAEALLLAQRGGADMGQVRTALRGGFAESRVLEVHGQRMVDHDFAKRGSLAIQLKDMRNALHTAQGMGLDIPITQHLGELYAQAVTNGLAELDQSGLYVALAQRPPLSAPKDLP